MPDKTQSPEGLPQKLSDAIVKGQTAPAKGSTIKYDAGPNAIRGFGIRITAAGVRAFVLNYVIAGRERRITIGGYPEYTVAAARKRAAELRQDISRGIDPLAARVAEREAPTINNLADRYIQEWAKPQKRTAAADESILLRLVRPDIGNLKVKAVEYADIDRLHRKISKTAGPYQANRVLSLLSKMFSLAALWKMRDENDNPTKGIARNHEEARERFIEGGELQRLTDALAAHKNQQVANVLRMLLLTGARRGEVLNMTWEQVNLSEGVWVKPSAHTKQKRPHRVPLSAPALMLLSEIRAEAERAAKEKGNEVSQHQRVFPAPISTGQMIGPVKRGWKSICKAAGIENARPHDLRHSYASFLINSGHSLPIIGRLLGHTQASTTQRYAHLADDPLRQATERVGAIVTGKSDGGEVIEGVDFGKGRGRAG